MTKKPWTKPAVKPFMWQWFGPEADDAAGWRVHAAIAAVYRRPEVRAKFERRRSP